jgi:hypothetical protein
MTPVRRPDIRAPGKAAAETAGNEIERFGDAGLDTEGDERIALDIGEFEFEGFARGVTPGDGEAASTIHILCERVATSLATVCARVERGVTWKTVDVNQCVFWCIRYVCLPGNESFPSPIPLSLRMTEMKWIQLDFNRGKLELLIRSLTSTVEMFPTTLNALSTTAILVRPSSFIN